MRTIGSECVGGWGAKGAVRQGSTQAEACLFLPQASRWQTLKRAPAGCTLRKCANTLGGHHALTPKLKVAAAEMAPPDVKLWLTVAAATAPSSAASSPLS